MRSVMSTFEPFGTWQYAHNVCWPVRGTGVVHDARLDDEAERSVRVTALRDVLLRRGDLGERAADMDRPRAPARLRAPRHGTRKRPVDLEDAWTSLESSDTGSIASTESFTGDVHESPRRRVEQRRSCLRKITELADRSVHVNAHALLVQRPDEAHR